MKKIVTFLLVASVLVFSTTSTYAASRGRHWGSTSDTTSAEHRVCRGEGECTYPDCPKNQTQESGGTLCPNNGTPVLDGTGCQNGRTPARDGSGCGRGRNH